MRLSDFDYFEIEKIVDKYIKSSDNTIIKKN